MHANLHYILERLNIPLKPRYNLDEVGEVLGIRRDQVLDLLRRRQIIGMKSSSNRWSGVFADDLDAYLLRVNSAQDSPFAGDSQSPVSLKASASEGLPGLETAPIQPVPTAIHSVDYPKVETKPVKIALDL